MATIKEWLSLSERCEESTGSGRAISEAILSALGYKPFSDAHWFCEGKGHFNVANRITASLDAITALIERELPGQHWLSGQAGDLKPGVFSCWIMPPPGPCDMDIVCYAATEPLARCAAFCRAMAERTEA